MFKYSFDFKFKAVKYVVYGKHSYREAARKFNVHQEQIRVWTNRYRTYGKNGLIPKPIQKYDGKFKVDVVEYMYANHLSFEKTAIHFGLPSSTNVVLWKQMYDEKGAQYLLNNRNIAIDRVRVNRVKKKKNKQNTNSNTSIKSTSKSSLKSDKSNAELLKEIEDLRMENDYLKKLQALVQKRTSQQKKKRH